VRNKVCARIHSSTLSERKVVPLEQSENLPWDGAILGFRLSIYLGGYLTMHSVSRY
jgi:hypothetical protein